MNKKTCLSEVILSDCILLHPKCRERAKRTISIMRNGEVRLNRQFMKEFDLSVSNNSLSPQRRKWNCTLCTE